MIALTEAAQKEIIRQNKSKIVRLGVRAGGCNGFSYVFEYAYDIKSNDKIFEFNDIKIVVDPKSFNYLDGTVIDFVSGIQGHGFKIENPHVKKNCSCGESFNV